MGPSPVMIFVGGALLQAWTSMKLSRNKKDMTGSLTVEIFAGSIPDGVIARSAKKGAPILVYVGGHLAFTGTVDDRKGKGQDSEAKSSRRTTGANGSPGRAQSGVSARIGPDEYKITLTARGKTKRLVDSSHDVKEGTTTGAKTQPIAQKLIKNFGVQLDWRVASHDMDKSVLRDGTTVKDELHRLGNEYGYHVWEARDGRLRVADQAGPETGEPIILGQNILTFETSQSEDKLNSDVTVKGQRTKKDIRGKAAVNRTKRIKMPGVTDYSPLVLQHYTDASDEALDRRARFEANNRMSDSFNVTVEVFHVQSRSGEPWDIGTLHYVEVPCEGVFSVMECISLDYDVDAKKNLKTKMALAPPPASASGAGAAGLAAAGPAVTGGLAALAGTIGGQAAAIASIDISAARMALHGFNAIAGQYPDAWGATAIVDVASDAAGVVAAAANQASGLAALAFGGSTLPPLTLPAHILGGIVKS